MLWNATATWINIGWNAKNDHTRGSRKGILVFEGSPNVGCCWVAFDGVTKQSSIDTNVKRRCEISHRSRSQHVRQPVATPSEQPQPTPTARGVNISSRVQSVSTSVPPPSKDPSLSARPDLAERFGPPNDS
jgi:hypothetical protein